MYTQFTITGNEVTVKPILISPLALDETEQKILNVAADLLFNEGIDCAILNENDTRGHIIVIDTANDNEQVLLNQTRDGQIKILLSTKFYYDKNIISIAKPISVNTLKELIYKISLKLRTAISEANSDLEINQATVEKNISEQSIFHTLLDAKLQNKFLKISGITCPDLYIDGKTATIASSAQHSEIETILSNSIENFSITEISQNDYKQLSDGLNISSLNGKLWFTGIIFSKGILLQGHDINEPFKLKAWPNFTRHGFKTEHLKLAAILARQFTTIKELEISTHIAQDEIINFYNAAFAVDLIDIHKNNDNLTEHSTQKLITKKTKNILHRLAVHLHIG